MLPAAARQPPPVPRPPQPFALVKPAARRGERAPGPAGRSGPGPGRTARGRRYFRGSSRPGPASGRSRSEGLTERLEGRGAAAAAGGPGRAGAGRCWRRLRPPPERGGGGGGGGVGGGRAAGRARHVATAALGGRAGAGAGGERGPAWRAASAALPARRMDQSVAIQESLAEGATCRIVSFAAAERGEGRVPVPVRVPSPRPVPPRVPPPPAAAGLPSVAALP